MDSGFIRDERKAVRLIVTAICLFCLNCIQAQTKPDVSQYPASKLSTKELKAALYLPDSQKGYYRGTRFDWSGLISRVDYAGHTFFCEFREQQHDPLNHDDICGTAEEFGMTTLPLGFAEEKPGEPFVKIGVGVLERSNDPEYAFWKKYKILQPGTWNIQTKPDSIEFTQSLNTTQGWSYEYTKAVRLDDTAHAVTITRRLKNTGTKKIDTDHYGHNFLKIDDIPAGPDYVFEFPFQPRFGEGSKPEGCVELKDKTLVFLKQVPAGKSVWVRLDGFSKPSDSQMRIVNRRTGAAMTIQTDKPLLRFVYYSSDGVLAPEPFVKLDLEPGETTTWTTTYTFETPGTKP